MHLTIDPTVLVRDLTRVAGATTRGPIAILANCLITAGDAGMRMRAGDQELAIETATAATVTTPGRVCVNPRDVLTAVRGSKSPITLELDDKHLVISSGRSRVRLVTLDPAEYPSRAEGRAGRQLTLPAPALLAAIAATIDCASVDAGRPNISGVHIVSSDSCVRLEATDGHRLARYTLETGGAAIDAIVPTRALAELRKSLSAGDVTITATDTEIRFAHGDTEITSRLVDGAFPNVDRVLPSTVGATRIEADRAELLAQVRHVSAFAHQKNRIMRMRTGANLIDLTSADVDRGECLASLQVAVEGAPVLVGANADYVVDALTAHDSARVEIYATDSLRPLLIRAVGDSAGVWVVMPVRL